jgi:hypothetical protein
MKIRGYISALKSRNALVRTLQVDVVAGMDDTEA